MTVSGQLFGREAIREGYTHDSMGLPIDPGATYDYEGVIYTELTKLWRHGAVPKVFHPLTRNPQK